MIELRWVNRIKKIDRIYDGGIGYAQIEKVLQYRTCQNVDSVFPGLPSGAGPWSEWQDVPEVQGG